MWGSTTVRCGATPKIANYIIKLTTFEVHSEFEPGLCRYKFAIIMMAESVSCHTWDKSQSFSKGPIFFRLKLSFHFAT